MNKRIAVSVAVAFIAAFSVAAWFRYRPNAAAVHALGETAPVASAGDAADDPAIWIDPSRPERSRVIGTDKEGGLHVFDLDGREVQRFEGPEQNNVDLRSGFSFGDGRGDGTLVLSSTNRLDKVLVYRLDPATGTLRRLIESTLRIGIDAEGICLYRSAQSGKFYFFVTGDDSATQDDGWVEQWEVRFDAALGRVVAERARRFDVGGEVEGCACDDANGAFFVSEENTAVWRYAAEPGAATDGTTESVTGPDRVAIDRLDEEGNLRYNAEGIAIYGSDGKDPAAGYLIVSSQGSDDYCVYDRIPPHGYRGRFRIAENSGIDAVTHTDGIDVTTFPLDARFPRGMFVAQDDQNDGAHQNFKFASWADVAAVLALP